MKTRCTQSIDGKCKWLNGETHCINHGQGKDCKVDGNLAGKMQMRTPKEKMDIRDNPKGPNPFYRHKR